jgi:BirA family transcriptional regulator, biotin operon repressor / biotin---[acetyl-CoA-carboxylase] ligase
MTASDHLGEPEQDLIHWPVGWTINHVAETGSTNSDLLMAAGRGAPDRSVLVSDHQTAGRGRLDRTWQAPPGSNLLVSFLFRTLPLGPNDVTRRLGLAVCDATARLVDGVVSLKWPNDVLIDDRKLAGILAQRAPDGDVVVGLGMNIGWAPTGAAQLGKNHSALEVLRAILLAFDALPADIDDRYRTALSTLGRRVRIEMPTSALVGTAIDVERDGRLVVLDECAVSHRIDAGDIVHLRPV